MFDQIFLSPQVKQRLIISWKHGLYELPYEWSNKLKNYLRSSEISKYEENLTTSQNFSLALSLPLKMKFCQYQQNFFWKIEIELFRHCNISHEKKSLPQTFCAWLQFFKKEHKIREHLALLKSCISFVLETKW